MKKARAYTKKELEAKIKKFEDGIKVASDDNEKAKFENGLLTFKKKLDALAKDVEKEVETPTKKSPPKKDKKNRGTRGSRSRKPKKEGTWQDFVKANAGSGKTLKELSVEWKGGKKPSSSTKKPSSSTKKPSSSTKKGGKRGISVVNTKTVSVDGKEMKMDSAEFCAILLDKWKGRRNKSKTKSGKKTTSVMSRVTTNIEKGIKQAIKGGVDKSKKTIAKNPTPFFNKIDKLESSTKSFLESLKAVMGDEYEKSEIATTMKTIESFVADLKEKFEKK